MKIYWLMQFRINPCVYIYIYMTRRAGAWFIRFLYILFFPSVFIILIIKCTLCDTPCGRHHRRRLNNKTVFTTRIWRREQHNILWIFIRYVLPSPLSVSPRIGRYIIIISAPLRCPCASTDTPLQIFVWPSRAKVHVVGRRWRVEGVKYFDVPLLYTTYIYKLDRLVGGG